MYVVKKHLRLSKIATAVRYPRLRKDNSIIEIRIWICRPQNPSRMVNLPRVILVVAQCIHAIVALVFAVVHHYCRVGIHTRVDGSQHSTPPPSQLIGLVNAWVCGAHGAEYKLRVVA